MKNGQEASPVRSVVNRGRQMQGAPGALETVRELLNTWLIPNATRVPEDRFAEFDEARGISDEEARAILRFRDDLRAIVEGETDGDRRINRWIQRRRIVPSAESGSIVFGPRGHLLDDLVSAVVESMAAGSWPRLKACPDCRWVFFDRSRNGKKRWCLMTAGSGEGSRSCGSIAKVRRWRERHRRTPASTATVLPPPWWLITGDHGEWRRSCLPAARYQTF